MRRWLTSIYGAHGDLHRRKFKAVEFNIPELIGRFAWSDWVNFANSHIKAVKSSTAKHTFNEKVASYNLGLASEYPRRVLRAQLYMQPGHYRCSMPEIDRMVDIATALPGGAMETFQKARRQGKVRYLGFSAHSEEAAHAALDRFDFDSMMFPLGFTTWIKSGFGQSVHKRVKEAGLGIIAIKAMAHQKWPKSIKRRWNKTWYEPFDTVDKAALGLRFSLHLPVSAMLPPGHWELFKMAVELAQSATLVPLNPSEGKIVAAIAKESDVIFAN